MANVVRMTLPLFIRLLEYAHEDAKSDIDLHQIAERASQCSGIMDTDEYSKLVPQDKKNLRTHIKEAINGTERAD